MRVSASAIRPTRQAPTPSNSVTQAPAHRSPAARPYYPTERRWLAARAQDSCARFRMLQPTNRARPEPNSTPHNLRIILQPRMIGSIGGEDATRWSIGITLAYW